MEEVKAEFVEYSDIPGIDPIISQRTRLRHPEIDFTQFGDSFVYLVSTFTSKESILTIMRTDFNHMEWMCKKTFNNMGFNDAYNYFKDITVQQCKEMFKDFAADGMAYPQQVLAKYLLGFKDEDDSPKSYNVKVIGAVPIENEK